MSSPSLTLRTLLTPPCASVCTRACVYAQTMSLCVYVRSLAHTRIPTGTFVAVHTGTRTRQAGMGISRVRVRALVPGVLPVQMPSVCTLARHHPSIYLV